MFCTSHYAGTASLPVPTVHSLWLCAVPPVCLTSPGSYSARVCWKVKRTVLLHSFVLCCFRAGQKSALFHLLFLAETRLDMYVNVMTYLNLLWKLNDPRRAMRYAATIGDLKVKLKAICLWPVETQPSQSLTTVAHHNLKPTFQLHLFNKDTLKSSLQ